MAQRQHGYDSSQLESLASYARGGALVVCVVVNKCDQFYRFKIAGSDPPWGRLACRIISTSSGRQVHLPGGSALPRNTAYCLTLRIEPNLQGTFPHGSLELRRFAGYQFPQDIKLPYLRPRPDVHHVSLVPSLRAIGKYDCVVRNRLAFGNNSKWRYRAIL